MDWLTFLIAIIALILAAIAFYYVLVNFIDPNLVGSTGAQGDAGEQGPPGATGASGPPGSPGYIAVTDVSGTGQTLVVASGNFYGFTGSANNSTFFITFDSDVVPGSLMTFNTERMSSDHKITLVINGGLEFYGNSGATYELKGDMSLSIIYDTGGIYSQLNNTLS